MGALNGFSHFQPFWRSTVAGKINSFSSCFVRIGSGFLSQEFSKIRATLPPLTCPLPCVLFRPFLGRLRPCLAQPSDGSPHANCHESWQHRSWVSADQTD
eukprot:scpid99617/ scgid13538/ 